MLLPFCQRVLKIRKPLKSPVLRFLKNYPANPVTIGERLRKWRIDLGLTYREASQKLGVSLPTYNHWESGRFIPPERQELRIAGVLGLAADTSVLNPAHAVSPFR